MENKIQIVVNDHQEMVPEAFSLSDLITYMEEADVHLIVELNGKFIYPQKYDSTMLSEGDSIELINPDFGG